MLSARARREQTPWGSVRLIRCLKEKAEPSRSRLAGGAVVAFDDVELDASILGPTGDGLVRGDRTIRTVALCCQSRFVNTVLKQPGLDAASTTLRQVDVVEPRTLAVGVSFDADQADSRCCLQRTGDCLKHWEALLQDHILVGGKVHRCQDHNLPATNFQ